MYKLNKKQIFSKLKVGMSKNTLNLKITHSWLNVLGDNSHNNPHSHPGTNETNSGVFYLSRNNNNITFTRDSNIFELKPTLFDLIVFPYDLFIPCS